MKKILIALGVIVLVGVGTYFLINSGKNTNIVPNQEETNNNQNQNENNNQNQEEQNKAEESIGKSVEGRDIMAYHYGEGDKEIVFVAGVHGGYAWNAVLLAYQLSDYLKTNPGQIPDNVKVTVIPELNPDGVFKVTGISGRFTAEDVSTISSVLVSGRFNGNNVDINRNFDCGWKTTGVWQNKTVSGGSAAFSEPESAAIKNYVLENKPALVVAFDSASGEVFSSLCEDGVLPETQTVNTLYANASGYQSRKTFDYYELTGDMTDWMAKNNIPAISVLLSDHTNIEWAKNLAGIKAIFEHLAD
jgi:murein tripeptide amidase MpaA